VGHKQTTNNATDQRVSNKQLIDQRSTDSRKVKANTVEKDFIYWKQDRTNL